MNSATGNPNSVPRADTWEVGGLSGWNGGPQTPRASFPTSPAPASLEMAREGPPASLPSAWAPRPGCERGMSLAPGTWWELGALWVRPRLENEG